MQHIRDFEAAEYRRILQWFDHWPPQRIGEVHNTFVTVVESDSNAKLIDILSGRNL